MSHMQPQIIECTYWVVEQTGGTIFVPTDDAPTADVCRDYLNQDEEILSIEKETGWLWRLSAPGCLDCTDWGAGESLQDALSALLSYTGEEFDEDDYKALCNHVEGLREFVDGYLEGMGFTATSHEGDAVFGCQGEWTDHYSADDVYSVLSDSEKIDVWGDCAAFFAECSTMWGDAHGQAGTDFHLSRNCHGCGYFDGDYGEFCTALQDAAKVYGTCELTLWDDGNGKEYALHD